MISRSGFFCLPRAHIRALRAAICGHVRDVAPFVATLPGSAMIRFADWDLPKAKRSRAFVPSTLADLITRRSQVRILPPLLPERPAQAGFFFAVRVTVTGRIGLRALSCALKAARLRSRPLTIRGPGLWLDQLRHLGLGPLEFLLEPVEIDSGSRAHAVLPRRAN